MTHSSVLRLSALLVVVAGGALVSAQNLPSSPAKVFGGSVTPAYEGWFDNPDGTHTFLIGYYSRNTQGEVEVPLGPNNKFEPGNPDRGQPTHFLTRRRYGMFTVTVPKDFGKTQRITWTLNVNGTSTTVPFHMHTDYNITPTKSQEESPNREFNVPPTLRFSETGPSLKGPFGSVATAIERTATVGTPMPLEMWSEDDALWSSGGNGPMSESRPILEPHVSKYRGPGKVTVSTLKFDTLKGGKPAQAYAGKALTTVSFSEPGEYMLHVNINDYSGNGGGGSGCCWTTAIIKVSVKGGTNTAGGH